MIQGKEIVCRNIIDGMLMGRFGVTGSTEELSNDAESYVLWL